MSDQERSMLEYSIFNKKDSEDYNKFMQEMTERIDSIMLKFKGYQRKYNPQTGETLETKVGEPMLNEKGLRYVEAKLETYLNPNLYMAEIDQAEVIQNYEVEVVAFSETLYKAKEEYDASTRDIERILSLVCPVIAFALIKAKTDKGFIRDTMRTTSIIKSADRESSKGLSELLK